MKNRMQLVSVLMIFLIITMPVCMAIDMQIVKISGDAGHPFFRKGTDSTKIEVKIDSSGQQVLPQDVTIGPGYPLSFDTCTKPDSYYHCFFQRTNAVNEGKNSFTVSYKTITRGTSQAYIYIDSSSPEVTIARVAQTGNKVDIAYDVNDNPDEPGCSGIRRIVIRMDDQVKETNELNTSDCGYASAASIPLEGASSGSHDFCVQATDNVGNVNQKCSGKSIDLSTPQVGNVMLLQAGYDTPLTALTSAATPARVVVNFSEPDLDTSKVSADLSSLNPTNKNYADKPANQCLKTGSIYRCVWNIEVAVSGQGPYNVRINAKDIYGNSISQEASFGDIVFDKTAPAVTRIKTDTCDSTGKCYTNLGWQRIIAEIEETGSGFNKVVDCSGSRKKAVYFELSEFNPAYAGAQICADKCEQSGSIWRCFAIINVTASYSEMVATVVSPTQDDAGNLATGETAGTIYFDNTPPVANASSIYIPLTAPEGLRGTDVLYHLVGAPLFVYANASDSISGIKEAYGNFVNVIGSNKTWVRAAACSAFTGFWQCVWDPSPGYIKGPNAQGVNFSITFFDLVNNSFTVSSAMNITGINLSEMNYWHFTGSETYPYSVDRQVTSLVNYPIYSTAHLAKNDPASNINIVSQQLQDKDGNNGRDACTIVENITKTIDYFVDNSTNLFLIPTAGSMFNPIIGARLAKKDKFSEGIDLITLNCSLRMISVIGGSGGMRTQPEYVSVYFNISFYDMPLGEYGTAVEKEINNTLNNNLIQKGAWWSGLSDFLRYAQKICGVMNNFMNVVTAIDSVYSAFAGVASGMPTSGPLKAFVDGLKAVSDTTETAAGTFWQIMSWACAVPTCEIGKKIFPDKPPQKSWYTIWREALNFYYGRVLLDVMKFNPAQANQMIDSVTNPEDSLFTSIINLCPAGIIYNVNKARQIECDYVLCLRDKVPAGYPLFMCPKLRAFNWCTFVKGELYELVPLAPVVRYFTKLIANGMKNPMTLLSSLVTVFDCRKLCQGGCASPWQYIANMVCKLNGAVSAAFDVYNYVNAIKGEDYWKFSTDMCPCAMDKAKCNENATG